MISLSTTSSHFFRSESPSVEIATWLGRGAQCWNSQIIQILSELESKPLINLIPWAKTELEFLELDHWHGVPPLVSKKSDQKNGTSSETVYSTIGVLRSIAMLAVGRLPKVDTGQEIYDQLLNAVKILNFVGGELFENSRLKDNLLLRSPTISAEGLLLKEPIPGTYLACPHYKHLVLIGENGSILVFRFPTEMAKLSLLLGPSFSEDKKIQELESNELYRQITGWLHDKGLSVSGLIELLSTSQLEVNLNKEGKKDNVLYVNHLRKASRVR